MSSKIDREVASIYHEIERILEEAKNPVKQYVLEVPQEMKIPNISYSFPEISPGTHSLNAYRKNSMLFLTVFHTNTYEAMHLAEFIIDEISKNKNKIPLVDENGKATQENMRLSEYPSSSKIEEGVAQIEIHYPRYPEFAKNTGEKINNYNIDLGGKYGR